MLTAREVAAYFIRKSGAMGDGNEELSGYNDLTNLKLQKLLYFAQAKHLKVDGEPLFSDDIEAWKYGPVVRDVYNWLKDCGGYVISEFDVDTSVANGIEEADKQFLDEFWREYDDYSAWGLVEKTHKSGSPWSKVYNEGAGNSEVIPRELIKEEAEL